MEVSRNFHQDRCLGTTKYWRCVRLGHFHSAFSLPTRHDAWETNGQKQPAPQGKLRLLAHLGTMCFTYDLPGKRTPLNPEAVIKFSATPNAPRLMSQLRTPNYKPVLMQSQVLALGTPVSWIPYLVMTQSEHTSSTEAFVLIASWLRSLQKSLYFDFEEGRFLPGIYVLLCARPRNASLQISCAANKAPSIPVTENIVS